MRVVVVPLMLALFPVLTLSASSCGTGVQADDDEGDDDDDDDDDQDPDPLDACEVPDDCSVFEACIDGFCRRECGPDEPCLGARGICDVANGACVQCLENVHCGDGEVCNSVGDCQPDVTTVCTPNELGCIDAATAFVCSGDGSERIEAPCRDDQFCEAGVCRTLVCEPNSVVCSGNALVVCNSDGTESDAEICDEASCDDDGFGCTCADGSCEARACAAGEARCVGNAAQQCDADGLAFGDLEDCGDDSCIAGACLPDECTAGDTSCAGAVLLTCDADGIGYDEVTCDEACVESADGAACGDQVCTPLSQECADGDTLVVCNASGSGASTQPCGADRFCEDGACQNEVCTPNERTCIGSGSVAACNTQGSDETVTPCGADETCEDGVCIDETCVPACGTRDCGPDPVCGASCGSCAGTCSTEGECLAGDGPLLVVELTWTPTSQDMDLYLSRDPDGTMCISDTCSLHTCTPGDGERPDWDASGNASEGDPSLVDGPTENPERIEIRLGSELVEMRVGADNVGPTTGGGSAAATSATVRLRLDGVLVDSHVRTVPIGALWKGVQVTWDGGELTSTDLEVITDGFDCTAPAGNACTTDSDCPAGQGCVDNGFIGGTCGQVDCLDDGDCGGFLACNGNHACTLGITLVEWKEDCRNGDGNTDTANCRVGFHCDFFTASCEEACAVLAGTAGTATSCSGVANCCEKSGGSECLSDAFLGISGNCEP